MDLKYIMLSERNQTQNVDPDPKLQVHGFPRTEPDWRSDTLSPQTHRWEEMLAEWRHLQNTAPREKQAGLKEKSRSVWSKGGVEHDLLVFERKNTHTPTSVNVAKAWMSILKFHVEPNVSFTAGKQKEAYISERQHIMQVCS